MSLEIKKLLDNNDFITLRHMFVNGLDADPTFDSYESEFELCKQKNSFFDEYKELTEFKTNPEDYTDRYWAYLKYDLIENFSEKRFEHAKEVAKIVYKDRIKAMEEVKVMDYQLEEESKFENENKLNDEKEIAEDNVYYKEEKEEVTNTHTKKSKNVNYYAISKKNSEIEFNRISKEQINNYVNKHNRIALDCYNDEKIKIGNKTFEYVGLKKLNSKDYHMYTAEKNTNNTNYYERKDNVSRNDYSFQKKEEEKIKLKNEGGKKNNYNSSKSLIEMILESIEDLIETIINFIKKVLEIK